MLEMISFSKLLQQFINKKKKLINSIFGSSSKLRPSSIVNKTNYQSIYKARKNKINENYLYEIIHLLSSRIDCKS